MSLVKQNHSIFYENDKRYTLQDFYEIEKEIEYVLSEKIKNILQKLSDDVGIPLNAVNENNTNNNNHINHMKILGLNPNGGRSRGGGGGNRLRGICFKSVSGEDTWDNIKKTNEHFKKIEITKIEKAEGIEKIIQEIRICLNKMTDKNYTKQRDEIKDKMKTISIMNSEDEDVTDEEKVTEKEKKEEKGEEEKENWDEEDIKEEKGETEKNGKTENALKKQKEEEWKKVGKVLFDIASTNKFFSKMYAQLYLELIEEFALFQEIIDTFIEGFITKLQTIKYVDPDKDYDGYCKYTKQQDERKAMTGFLVNLGVGYLVLGGKGREMVKKLSQIVFELAEKVTDLLDKESSTNEIEEITEILFLFFSIGGKFLIDEWKKGEKWEGIFEKMLNLSKQKVKEHKSLSSRALFKFLDIQKIIMNL